MDDRQVILNHLLIIWGFVFFSTKMEGARCRQQQVIYIDNMGYWSVLTYFLVASLVVTF